MKSFNHFLKLVKENSGQLNWMVGIIPSFEKWTKKQNSSIIDDTSYVININDQSFIINDVEFYKENIGKEVKFKYNPETREVFYAIPVVKESHANPIVNPKLLSTIISEYSLNGDDAHKVECIIMSNYDGTRADLISKIKQVCDITSASDFEIEELFAQHGLSLESINEGLSASDLKNVLTKYTQFLFDNNYLNDSVKGQSIDKILTTFLQK